MATRETTTTRKATATKKAAAPSSKSLVFSDVETGSFPKLTRANRERSTEFDAVAKEMAPKSLKGKGLEKRARFTNKEDAMKIGAQVRNAYRYLFNRSLKTVWVDAEKMLYMRDNGEIKQRQTAQSEK